MRQRTSVHLPTGCGFVWRSVHRTLGIGVLDRSVRLTWMDLVSLLFTSAIHFSSWSPMTLDRCFLLKPSQPDR